MLKKNKKIIKTSIKLNKIININKINKSILAGQFLFFLLFLFFLFFIFISPFSAEAVSSQWVTINTTGVMINATYNESVILVNGYPKIIDSNNQSFSLKTDSLNNGKTFVSRRSALPAGTYTYVIWVQDRVGNKRNDSREFEINPAYPKECGDKRVNGTEECDDGNNIDGDGCSAYCKLESCGNNRIDAGEECETNNLNGQSCTTIGSFLSGALNCNSDCTFNVKNCVPVNESGICGDYVLNDAEVCDKNDWGMIKDCKNFVAFISGALKCKEDCHFDTSSCVVKGNTLNSSCLDNTKDGDETDVDCGGSCLACDDGKKCSKDEDCLSYYCKAGVCAPPSCTDGLQNGLEPDVDCGASCPACTINKSCNKDSDCISNFCRPVTRKCSVSSCIDSLQNGDESDVDCGGGCTKKCGPGQKCVSGNDCLSARCEVGICTVDRGLDTDEDGIPDWWEDKFGLNKDDSSDADENSDKDGCTNLDEYNEDTDPTIPDCGEKNRTLQIILLIFGLLLMLGSAGFLVYYRKVLAPQQKTKPAATDMAQRSMPAKAQVQTQAQPQRRFTPSALAQSRGERKSLLQGFDTAKPKAGKEAETGKGAGAPATGKDEENFIPLSSLGKKPGQAKEQKEEKASQPKQESSATFDKLKALSDSYKKKKESKK